MYLVIEIYAVTILMTFFCFRERYWTTESSPRVLMVVQLPCYNTILALCRLLLELTRSNVRHKPNVDAEIKMLAYRHGVLLDALMSLLASLMSVKLSILVAEKPSFTCDLPLTKNIACICEVPL